MKQAESKFEITPVEQLGLLKPEGFPGLPENWVCRTTSSLSSDGKLKLFSYLLHDKELSTNSKNKRVLILVHGQGEHGGRYFHFPHYLKDAFSAVALIDLRGHGRSEGLRGHVDFFDQYTLDVIDFIRMVQSEVRLLWGEGFVFDFLGHSMGGLVALRVLIKEPYLNLKTATVSAPLLALKSVPKLKEAGARVINFLWGSLQLGNEVNPGGISHDPEVQKAYVSDRLVHSKVTPRFYFSLKEAMASTLQFAEQGKLSIPLHFIIPLEDPIVDASATVGFAETLDLEKKRISLYQGYFHESFNEGGDRTHPEINKERVFKDQISWIAQNS